VVLVPSIEPETGMLLDKLEPGEPLGILVETPSLLAAEARSGLRLDEEDDGARVAADKPTGYGATGMSASEDADGL